MGTIGSRGIPPGQTAPGQVDAAAPHLATIPPLHTPFLTEEGVEGCNLLLAQPGTPGPSPILPILSWASFSGERVLLT